MNSTYSPCKPKSQVASRNISLRPDLGRLLSDDAKRIINEKCQKNVNIQLVVGDGLSAAAIEANLRQIFPVIRQGTQTAGLTFGTPFFIKYARVGVMNDVGELIKPDVVILLIGERPGLGRARIHECIHGLQTQIRRHGCGSGCRV